MVGLWQASERFDGRGRFDAYARSRIKGAVVDWVRRADWLPRLLRRQRPDLRPASLEDARADPEAAQDGNLACRELWEYLTRGLTFRQLLCATRCFLDGRQQAEVARGLGCSQANVSLILSAARQHMRARLVQLEGGHAMTPEEIRAALRALDDDALLERCIGDIEEQRRYPRDNRLWFLRDLCWAECCGRGREDIYRAAVNEAGRRRDAKLAQERQEIADLGRAKETP